MVHHSTFQLTHIRLNPYRPSLLLLTIDRERIRTRELTTLSFGLFLRSGGGGSFLGLE